ncbi:mucin-3B-like [Lethenteron reissneri]|uniref:mucin-3B-like n=1 Tax=Lethenteron reissneri TaxID=7753 RepID=UPI002AB70F40|nr:mucin-3B-like [Lethenteron reissneri]
MSVRRAGAHGGVASTTVGARLPAGRGARGRAALASGVQVGARGGPGDAEIPRAHGERPPATPARRAGVESSEPGTRGLGRALGSGAELGFATLPGDLLRSRQKTQDSDIPGSRFTRSISLHNIPLHSQMEYRQSSSWGSSNSISPGSFATTGGRGQDTRMNNDIDAIKVELAKAEAMLGSMNQPSAVKSTYTSESSSSNGRPDAFIEEELKKVGSLLQKNSSSSETFSSFGSSHPSSSNGSALGSSFASGSFQPNAAGKPASSSSYSYEYQGGAASKPAGSTYSFEHQSSASAKPASTMYSSEYQSSAAGRPVSSTYSSEFNSSSAGAGPVNSYSSVEYQSGTSAKPMSSTYSREFQSSTAARPVSSTYSSEFNSSSAGAGPANSYSSVEYQSGTSAKPMSTTYSSEFQSSTAARPVSSTYSSEFNSSAAGAGPVNSYSSVDYQSGTSAKPMSTTYSSEFNSSSAAGPASRAYSSEYQGSGGSAGALKLPSSQNAESFNCGLQQQVQQSSRAEMSQSSQQQLLNKQKEIEAEMERLYSAVKMMEGGFPRDSIIVTPVQTSGSSSGSSTSWEPNISVTSSSSHSLQSLPEERKEDLEEMKPKAVSWADLKATGELESVTREEIVESAMTKTTAMPVGLWDFTLPPAYRPSNTSGSSGSAQAEGQHASEASVQATSSGALNAGRSWATSSGSTKLDAFGDADLTAVGDGSHGAKSECCGRVQAEAAALREKVQGMDELLKSQSRKMMVLHKQLDEKEQESVELRAQLQKLQAQSSSWSSGHSTSMRRMSAGGSTDYPLLRLAGTRSSTRQ